MDRENREEMREKVPVRKRVRKAREKGRPWVQWGEGQVIPFTLSALQTSPAMRWKETQEGVAAIWMFLRVRISCIPTTFTSSA